VISSLSNHSSYSPTPMDEKNKTSSSKKEQDIPINNLKKEHPIGMSFNSWHNEETGF